VFDTITLAVIGLVFLALAFDFTNGFHDAANSIATVVATGTLTPKQAVIMAAICNFGIMFFISLSVAATVGKGIVLASAVSLFVIAGALLGAIAWNLITWYFGLPTSSSHALIGSLVGATIVAAGPSVLIADGLIKVGIFIVAAPLLGFLLGAGINTIMRNLVPQTQPHHAKWFRRLQIASSAFYSMSHGANDAQKTAGIIWLILLAGGMLPVGAAIPMWAVYVSFVAMGLGTLAGGWRIVQTLGFKLTKLEPRGGFVAEAGGGVMVFGATALGIPVSTTQTITGAILGVGASEAQPRVKWKKATEIVIAWMLTIPASAFLGAAFEFILRAVWGV
jgi:PiT family inorganic phosphate transporter